MLDWFESDRPGARRKISDLVESYIQDSELIDRIHGMYDKVLTQFYAELESKQ
jgi:hypothetical protein